MKLPLILCFFLLFSSQISYSSQIRSFLARITWYHRLEAGGNHLACNGILKPMEGVSIAAHPDFPFGTYVMIPRLKGIIGSGQFVVEDRGSAVTAKTASKGKYYVFDVYIYVKNQKEADARMKWLSDNIPEYLEIYIY